MELERISMKQIEGFENYYVTNTGLVYNSKTEMYLKPICDYNKSYSSYHRYVVNLSKNGVMHRKLIHRLVAEAFIPNPEGKPQVDHINHDTFDNRVENLRWVTNKENSNNKQ